MKRLFERLIGLFACIVLLISTLFTPVALAADRIYELTFDNLFVFEQWANNVNSGAVCTGTPGELTIDIESGSFTLTNTATENIETYTAYSTTIGRFYSMPVEAETQYTFEFSVLYAEGATQSFDAFVFYYDSTSTLTTHDTYVATKYGLSEWNFTTPAGTSYIQIRFDNNQGGTFATVSDIRICKTEVFEETKDIDYRKTFTYSDGAVYGEIPFLEKSGYVFAGWFTGPDGTGDRITADTVMTASSYSLYSFWQPVVVGDLNIVSPPIKQTYSIGEKINTRGLVIGVTFPDGTKENIDEGFTCSPEIFTETGTQTVTVNYGNGSAEFQVVVNNGDSRNILLNNSEYSVTVANNSYTLNYNGSAFNRFELTYTSDAFVKGTMNFNGTVEEFFLEAGENETFSSFIDGFISGTTQTYVSTITFEPLNKEYMDFTLLSLNLSKATNSGDSEGMVYLSSTDYKIGIDLDWGGALTYLEDLSNSVVAAKDNSDSDSLIDVGFSEDYTGTYKEGGFTIPGTSTVIGGTTKDKYTTQGNVNLINCHDTGRLVQQSYYGAGDTSYEPGYYEGVAWPYNPVQGGNVYNEASKIVDLKVSDNEIYIKCRPLDWAREAQYITPTYMEAWYTLEDGLMRANCRFVDYSGYPALTTTQELPAFYCVEPLKNFVYYSGSEAWSDSNSKVTRSDLQFWSGRTDQNFQCNENWAAFVGNGAGGYGIGLYAPGQTEFCSGLFQRDTVTGLTDANGNTIDKQDGTAYIGVVDWVTFQSYTPIEYCYYITTGNVDTIRSNFKALAQQDTDICNATNTNGFCDMCGKQVAPTLTTDKYDINDDGAKDSVYEISNAGELFWFRDNVNSGNNSANAVLTADITINENLLSENGTPNASAISYPWSPIGTSSIKYNGIFNGQGHSISGLYFNDSTAQYAGLFGATSSSATIKEIAITDSYICANSYAGAFCGSNGGTIINCYTTRTVINGNTNGGGIAGASSKNIINCYSTASIYGSTYIGGICGNNSGAISNCYYLKNSAVNSSKVSQNGIGSSSASATPDTETQTTAKTLDEFYSGEVASLLQKANSTQLWGQKSNSENSSPIFDYSGDYKVISVTNEDAYSICSIGDIVDDDTIDILDYQQMANLAVSENTPSEDFRTLLLSDLNSDGYIDVLDCSVMALFINGIKNSINVYFVGDFNCDGIAFGQSDIVSIKKGLINQNTLSTREKYACDLNSDGVLDINDKDILSQKEEFSSKPIFIDITSSMGV